MLKPIFRHKIIEELLAKHGHGDILNMPFVEEYIQKTSAKAKVTMWGAPKCITLSKDLSAMYKMNLLSRFRIGINDHISQGFPSSVLVYKLK